MAFDTTSLPWSKSLHQSGGTFTTLGIVTPSDSAGIVMTFVAAFLGLVLVAVFVGYLIGLHSSWSVRESLMVRLAAEAGEAQIEFLMVSADTMCALASRSKRNRSSVRDVEDSVLAALRGARAGASAARELARDFHAVPAPWSGTRRPIRTPRPVDVGGSLRGPSTGRL